MKLLSLGSSIAQGFLGTSFLRQQGFRPTEPLIKNSDEVLMMRPQESPEEEGGEASMFYATQQTTSALPSTATSLTLDYQPTFPTPHSPSPLVPTRLRNFALNAIASSSSTNNKNKNNKNSSNKKNTTHHDVAVDEWHTTSEVVQDQQIAHALQVAQTKYQNYFLGDDRVEVNVGGGHVFLTSKSTLMSHSTYFQDRFMPEGSTATTTTMTMKSRWETLTPKGETPEQIFLDQDSEAFQVLLSYMRLGYIESTDISAKVLALADILGMEELLRAVKCVAFRFLNPSHVQTEDDEVCRRFDSAYGSVLSAVKSGILPDNIRPIPPDKVPTQIAQLLVYDGWVSNFQRTDLSMFVEVKVTANVLAEEGLLHPRAEGFDTVVVPDCHTTHDAINWLYNRGFEFTEKEYQTIQFPNDHGAWENLWFTRPLQTDNSSSDVIRFDPTIHPQVRRKRLKIASLLVSKDQMDAFLYADKGRKTRMGFPVDSNTSLPPHLPKSLRNEGFDSRIAIESSRNAWAVVSWLSENGYTEMATMDDPANSKLRKLLLEMQYRAFSHQEANADPDDRLKVDQDEVDFRLLSCEVPPDSKLFETWPSGPFE